MNQAIAPAELRFLIRQNLLGTGDGDSLQNVNTVPLPDGAMAFVKGDSSLWTLDKTVTGSTVPDQQVLPGSGPGLWFKFGSSSALVGPAQIATTGQNAFAVDGNWHATTSANSALSALPSLAWNYTPTGAILTYEGPTALYLVTLDAAVLVTNVGAPREVFVGISSTGVPLSGAPNADTSGELSTTCAVASTYYAISTQKLISLSNGQAIQPMCAAAAGAASLAAIWRMVATPVG